MKQIAVTLVACVVVLGTLALVITTVEIRSDISAEAQDQLYLDLVKAPLWSLVNVKRTGDDGEVFHETYQITKFDGPVRRWLTGQGNKWPNLGSRSLNAINAAYIHSDDFLVVGVIPYGTDDWEPLATHFYIG